jgi:hypothetical protein
MSIVSKVAGAFRSAIKPADASTIAADIAGIANEIAALERRRPAMTFDGDHDGLRQIDAEIKALRLKEHELKERLVNLETNAARAMRSQQESARLNGGNLAHEQRLARGAGLDPAAEAEALKYNDALLAGARDIEQGAALMAKGMRATLAALTARDCVIGPRVSMLGAMSPNELVRAVERELFRVSTSPDGQTLLPGAKAHSLTDRNPAAIAPITAVVQECQKYARKLISGAKAA